MVVVVSELIALVGYMCLRALPFANYFAADNWRNGHRSHPNRWKWEGLSGDDLDDAVLIRPLLTEQGSGMFEAVRGQRSALTSAIKGEDVSGANFSHKNAEYHQKSLPKPVNGPSQMMTVPSVGSLGSAASPVPAGSSPPVYSRSPSGKWRRVNSHSQQLSINRPGHFGVYAASPGMSGLSPVMGAHNWTPIVTSMETPGRHSSPTMAAGASFAAHTRQLQNANFVQSMTSSSNVATMSNFQPDEEQAAGLSRIPSQTEVESILEKGSFSGLNKRVWAYGYHVMFTFLVTLTLFPTFTSSICSVKNPAVHPPCIAHVAEGRIFGDLWTPLSFVLYNGGDMVGRMLCGIGAWAHRPPQSSSLIALSTLRIVFVPLILCCNIVRDGGWHFPYIFRHDSYPILFITLLGVTNGYLAGVALMHAPLFVHSPQRESAGAFMQFCLICGLTLGSAIALAVNQLSS